MNIIKQYAISHDLPIAQVEAVAQYIDPIVNPKQFAIELEAVTAGLNSWIDMQYLADVNDDWDDTQYLKNMDEYFENMVD